MTADTTAERRRMSSVERARDRCPQSELLIIDYAGQLTEQLELAQTMLAIAVDLLATLSGKYRDQVVDTLELAATVELA